MIFDTHAHYDDEAFDPDREAVFAQFPAAGIGRVVDPGSTRESLGRIAALTRQYPFLYGALGIHPSECTDMTEEWIGEIRALLHTPPGAGASAVSGGASAAAGDVSAVSGDASAASDSVPAAPGGAARNPKMVAIGEIGLDYHWDEPDRAWQQRWFRRQIALAREENLPIIIHSRDAAADTLQILKEEHAAEVGAVIHCYSYSAELAQELVRLGFYIGIGGVVTFKNGRKMKETAAAVPMDRILLETDSPYLAPVPYRGRRNSSLLLPYVVTAIAQIRGMSGEDVILQTQANAERFYRLPHAAG